MIPRWGLPLLLLITACRDRVFVAAPGGDAGGADREMRDSAAQGDGPGAPLALDISVTGCASFDVDTHQCVGTAPLTVTFSPVTSGPLDQFLWDFGDGSTSSLRAPVHTYTLPSAKPYDVSVTAGGPGVGSILRERDKLIAVVPAALGAACDIDAQCAGGLGCLCGSATASCPAAFARGLCSLACGNGTCPAGAVCADLSPLAGHADGGTGNDGGDAGAGADAGQGDGGADSPAPAPWQRPSCLASCTTDTDCGPGLSCRDLPGRAATGAPVVAWIKACFAGYPLDLGSSCRAADGRLRDDACTSGSCADMGSAGLCTAACATDADCPSGTACATFGDGRKLCLRACRQAGTCTYDPLLACESPGAAGPLGFTIAGSSNDPSATYCAPRGCLSAASCGPSGVCTASNNAAGHCVPR